MSECLPCSKVSLQEKDVVKYYQNVYKKTGNLYWVYRLKTKGDFLFTDSKSFKLILETQIKPNFTNGSEYFRIDEFKTL